MKLYQIKTPTCRSLRDLLFVIFGVAAISAIITYQLTKHLPTRTPAELTILLEQRNLQLDHRHGLEGIDIEDRVKRGHGRSHINRWKDHNKQVLEQVYDRLKKVEDSQIGRSVCKVVIFENGTYVHDSPESNLTYQLFTTNGCHVQYKVWEFQGKTKFEDNHIIIWLSQSINTLKGVSKWINTSQYTKVNKIPAIEEMVGSKAAMCTTIQKLKHIPNLPNSDLFPDCFILPEQLSDYFRHNTSDKWVYKSMGDGFGKLRLIDHSLSTDKLKLQKWSSEKALLQKYFPNPLLVYGMPFETRFFVLVTSWSPLRVYVHSEGLVQLRHHHQKHFQRLAGRTWTFKQLTEYISETYRSEVTEVMFNNAHSVILQTLLVLEAHSLSQQTERCTDCFQLLEFDIIFNASFHPVITEIKTDPGLTELAAQQKTIIKDLVSMVTASTQVAKDIAKMLVNLNLKFETQSDTCLLKEGVLSEEDILILLNARREDLNRGSFHMLYPSPSSGKYTHFIEELQQNFPQNTHRSKHPYHEHPTHHHSTSTTHSTLLAITKYFSNTDAIGDSYDDLTPQVLASQEKTDLIEHIHGIDVYGQEKYTRNKCSTAEDTRELLQGFHTNPNLSFTPTFHPNTTDYYARVPYEVILVQVWAFAEACQCEARLGDKYGLNRPSNYTVGLGTNTIQIHIVDTTHTDPWILNTYTLHLERQTHSELLQNYSDISTDVCRLLQDCNLKYIPSLPCGVQNSSFVNWYSYLQNRDKLPHCSNGYAPGEWMVPCNLCSAPHTCDMKRAVWQPYHCTHHVLPRHQLRQCLNGKQILFIGDSTNRGIMHYVMEQVNGSLTDWDKTHNIKIYSNINDERTTFSFAYYPQFWLTSSQRPVFDKALYQLMKQSMPLENNHNTVIVVGGVHWLSTHHLSVLMNALKREGLSQVKVVMKGLGAGFHQPVDALHCLSLREQRKLLLHNHNLLSMAQTYSFHIVDTFNMTMARYKDFSQGQCACHFHKVNKVSPLSNEVHTESTKNNNQVSYHIDGSINQVYSEILINRICDHY